MFGAPLPFGSPRPFGWPPVYARADPAPIDPNGPTHYHVYANSGDGGPIDYSSPVATVDGLQWTTPPLAFPAEWRFGVRAFGSISGLEEENVDAAVLILLDGSGADVTNRPAPPFGLRLRNEAGGRVVAEWGHPGGTRDNAPTGYRVYAGWPSPDYSAPVLTTTARAFHGSFSAVLEGLSDGPLAVGVRAFNATAEEGNADFAAVDVDGTPPDPVDGLTVSAVAG